VHKVYHERVFSGIWVILTSLLGLTMLGAVVYDRIFGVFGVPLATWTFLGTGIFLLLASVNLAFLSVTVSTCGVTTRFGLVSHTVPPDAIAETYQDKASSVAYGGFGIRFGWVNGKRRLVYSVVNTPRVVVQEGHASDHEFVFSTRNPEAVMRAIRQVSRLSGK
jgi:hypothetical protein